MDLDPAGRVGRNVRLATLTSPLLLHQAKVDVGFTNGRGFYVGTLGFHLAGTGVGADDEGVPKATA